MRNNKLDYAVDRVREVASTAKIIATWPWVAVKQARRGYSNPHVRPEDWWEEVVTSGIWCVVWAWVVFVFVMLVMCVSCVNCTGGHEAVDDRILIANDL